MKPYDIYVFFLCLIVFIALTVLFSFLIREIIKLTLRMIRHGVDDEKIIAMHNRPVTSARNKLLGRVFSVALCVLLLTLLICSTWLRLSENTFKNHSSLRVVASSSMSYQNKRNSYLFENNLNNQFNTFDLIVTRPVPDEFDLQLYDIVVYQFEDVYIIHRIVGIEEPNKKHPDSRLFTLQGDAVSSPDRELVQYDQIKAIYYGERVPFVGSFVFFMRSPAGWLCVLLIVLTMIATPIVEKRIERATMIRLHQLGIVADTELAKISVNKQRKRN